MLQCPEPVPFENAARAFLTHLSLSTCTVLSLDRPGTTRSKTKHAKLASDGPMEFEVPETFLLLLREFSRCFQEHISGEMVPFAGKVETCFLARAPSFRGGHWPSVACKTRAALSHDVWACTRGACTCVMNCWSNVSHRL